MIVRPERTSDHQAVFSIHAAAFETGAEAKLVNVLRRIADPVLSLVAEIDEAVIGHILFSPVTLDGDPALSLMGLAPMAVSPERQRQGAGSLLVTEGLNSCRSLGAVGVVVLGHPDYYPRFGFVPSSQYGIRSEYDVPDDTFLVQELRPGALAGKAGLVRYHEAFAGL